MKTNNMNEHFYNLLLSEIFANIANQYEDNYDEQRFGKIKLTWKSKIRNLIKKRFGFRDRLDDYLLSSSFSQLEPHLNDAALLYETLSDEQSKTLLIQVITYRILKHKKYKLPLNVPDFWENISDIEKLKNDQDYLTVNFPGRPLSLYRFDLKKTNIPIELYNTERGINNFLNIKQYEYVSDEVRIKPESGDVVLDCGACWGEMTLFFANEVKEKGHVYSFEFVPANIEVFSKNVKLNPHLKENITLVPYPLDEVSGKKMFYNDNGPASRVSNQISSETQAVTSISIDDFYDRYELNQIDFIKMDIEGAELPALKGSLAVLRKFRPKLAISIYHSMSDFFGISKYIDSLNLGYKFYLKHATIHHEETVLLAIAPNRK